MLSICEFYDPCCSELHHILKDVHFQRNELLDMIKVPYIADSPLLNL